MKLLKKLIMIDENYLVEDVVVVGVLALIEATDVIKI